MDKHSKGQMTIVNLVVLLFVAIVYFVFLPVITAFTTSYALPAIAASSMDQSTKDLTSSLVNLFPVVLLLGILITAIIYANPKREGS